MTSNLDSYRLPAMGDVPPLHIEWVDTGTGPGPLGAKPVGEVCVIPTAAAIANAVYDAIGVRVTALPVSPETLLSALISQSSARRR